MDLPLSFLWQCPQFLTRRSYFGCLNYIFKAVYGCSSLALGLKLIFFPFEDGRFGNVPGKWCFLEALSLMAITQKK